MESGACAAASGGACASLDGHPDAISILLLGEGNLSFTYALVKRLSRSAAVRRATQQSDTVAGEHWRGCVVRITATTFDSADALPCKYPEAAVFLAYFATKRRVPVRYHGDVNATALSSAAAPLRGQPFHLLFFNNPHIGFEDLYRQRALLSHFFCSARELYLGGSPLPCPQEVVIALCDDQARRWDLLGCAARSGYVCVAAVPLRPADFPEYTNRRHQSDAAFPFHQMVHYYFVLSASVPHALLHDLVAEMHAWERERDARLAAGLPCSYTCADWLRYARALLGDSAHAAAAVAPMDARDVAVGHLDAARCSDLSANTSSTGAPLQPVPLLHPALVANVVAGALGGSGGHAASPPTASLLTAATVGHAEVYTPYLPGSTWIALHRAQRAVEQQASACGDAAHSSSPEASEATAPPHLDAALLGRPLTSREAKKLERYLSGYGAAMKAKADLQRRRTSNAVGVWSCTECQPSRTFETAADLLQHQRSKHCGGVQLAPTLYARVHEQIEPSADNVATALADMNLEDDLYCAVCGLQFKDADAYAEHLRYLAPLPGEEEDVDLVCTACQPARTFTDRRALVQHVATKHPPPTAAVCHGA
ncbi:C2H2-type zinc finger containing protein [Novymonas esmeraldas]|uniref:C2H2-type zinc finger containing protein n=1 Tax=Novymonas esmeraldas TaxID=1808958 RepID=A0AAW0F2V7_9TRYP